MRVRVCNIQLEARLNPLDQSFDAVTVVGPYTESVKMLSEFTQIWHAVAGFIIIVLQSDFPIAT